METETIENTQNNQPSEEISEGTLGFVLSLIGLLFFQLLCIVSFIIAKTEKDQAAKLGVEPAGLTKAAFWISIAGLVILVAALIFIFLVAVLAVSLS